MAFVAFDDPRLAGPVRSATVGDPETTNAIAVLRKALLSPEHVVLSALSLGFSINVIGLRTSGGPVAFLNPQIVSASDFRPVEDETFVLTDIVRRPLIRPHRIVVMGRRETGEEASFTSEGPAAVQALQHLELIAGDGPMRWLSPTERLMLDPVVDPALRQSIRALYAATNDAERGLRQVRQGVTVLPLPIAPVAPGRLAATASRASSVDLRLRDPILPASASNLLLFAFSVAAARRQHALIVGMGALGSAVALRHMFPQLVIDLVLPDDAEASGPFTQLRLRPDERLRLQGEDLQAYETLIGRNEVDVIAIDLSGGLEEHQDEAALEADFRSVSRVMRGEGGLTIIAARQRDARVEKALKSTFVTLDCWTVEGLGIVYVGAKRAMARDLLLGRILDLAIKLQNPLLRDIFACRVENLGKDGQDRVAG